MDTRFSVAIHLLILISESETPISSAQMASSVGTNPSFIRKVLGSLKRAGLLESQQGRAGFSLAKAPEDLTLIEVYRALYGGDGATLFEMHRNPNDQCVVGRHIRSTLESVFGAAQHEVEGALASTTLADCIADMRERVVLADDGRS